MDCIINPTITVYYIKKTFFNSQFRTLTENKIKISKPSTNMLNNNDSIFYICYHCINVQRYTFITTIWIPQKVGYPGDLLSARNTYVSSYVIEVNKLL